MRRVKVVQRDKIGLTRTLVATNSISFISTFFLIRDDANYKPSHSGLNM